jgi:lysozyme
VALSQDQIDVLCSFIYNIGGEGFASSQLLKKINSCASCADIKAQFLRWKNSGGKPVLLGRRQREANLYCI